MTSAWLEAYRSLNGVKALPGKWQALNLESVPVDLSDQKRKYYYRDLMAVWDIDPPATPTRYYRLCFYCHQAIRLTTCNLAVVMKTDEAVCKDSWGCYHRTAGKSTYFMICWVNHIVTQ